jgi:hypothetical protein
MRSSTLKIHMEKHNKEKGTQKPKCNYPNCKKSFSTDSELERHIETHSEKVNK